MFFGINLRHLLCIWYSSRVIEKPGDGVPKQCSVLWWDLAAVADKHPKSLAIFIIQL